MLNCFKFHIERVTFDLYTQLLSADFFTSSRKVGEHKDSVDKEFQKCLTFFHENEEDENYFLLSQCFKMCVVVIIYILSIKWSSPKL